MDSNSQLLALQKLLVSFNPAQLTAVLTAANAVRDDPDVKLSLIPPPAHVQHPLAKQQTDPKSVANGNRFAALLDEKASAYVDNAIEDADDVASNRAEAQLEDASQVNASSRRAARRADQGRGRGRGKGRGGSYARGTPYPRSSAPSVMSDASTTYTHRSTATTPLRLHTASSVRAKEIAKSSNINANQIDNSAVSASSEPNAVNIRFNSSAAYAAEANAATKTRYAHLFEILGQDKKNQTKEWKCWQALLQKMLPLFKNDANKDWFTIAQRDNYPVSFQTHSLEQVSQPAASDDSKAMSTDVKTTERKGRRLDPLSIKSIDKRTANVMATAIFKSEAIAANTARILSEVVSSLSLQHAISVCTSAAEADYVTMRFNVDIGEINIGSIGTDIKELMKQSALPETEYITPWQKRPLEHIEVLLPKHKHAEFAASALFTQSNYQRKLRVRMDLPQLCLGCGINVCFSKRCADCTKQATEAKMKGQQSLTQLQSFCQYCNIVQSGDHYSTCAKRSNPDACRECGSKQHTTLRCEKFNGKWIPYEQSALVPKSHATSPTRSAGSSSRASSVASNVTTYSSVVQGLARSPTNPISILKRSPITSANQSPNQRSRVSFDSAGPSVSQTGSSNDKPPSIDSIMEAVDERINSMAASLEHKVATMLADQKQRIDQELKERDQRLNALDSKMEQMMNMMNMMMLNMNVSMNNNIPSPSRPHKAARSSIAASLSSAMVTTPIKANKSNNDQTARK